MSVKIPEWPIEDLRKLSCDEIEGILSKCEKFDRADIAKRCKIVMEEKACAKQSLPKKRKVAKSATKRVKDEISSKMGDFAKNLSKLFDLSKETAKILSKGYKGFRPHSLTDSRGGAKAGGVEISGQFEFYHYLSYRLGDEIISVSAYLKKDEDESAIKYRISSPFALQPDGAIVDEVKDSSTNSAPENTCLQTFKYFDNLTESLEAFQILMDQFIKHWQTKANV